MDLRAAALKRLFIALAAKFITAPLTRTFTQRATSMQLFVEQIFQIGGRKRSSRV